MPEVGSEGAVGIAPQAEQLAREALSADDYAAAFRSGEAMSREWRLKRDRAFRKRLTEGL